MTDERFKEIIAQAIARRVAMNTHNVFQCCVVMFGFQLVSMGRSGLVDYDWNCLLR